MSKRVARVYMGGGGDGGGRIVPKDLLHLCNSLFFYLQSPLMSMEFTGKDLPVKYNEGKCAMFTKSEYEVSTMVQQRVPTF